MAQTYPESAGYAGGGRRWLPAPDHGDVLIVTPLEVAAPILEGHGSKAVMRSVVNSGHQINHAAYKNGVQKLLEKDSQVSFAFSDDYRKFQCIL